jgi:hypothetical protein
VLGLTNYSYWAGAAALRACVRSNTIAREMLLTLAGRRLKRMAHVGLTERLAESVQSLAADLGAPLAVLVHLWRQRAAWQIRLEDKAWVRIRHCIPDMRGLQKEMATSIKPSLEFRAAFV